MSKTLGTGKATSPAIELLMKCWAKMGGSRIEALSGRPWKDAFRSYNRIVREVGRGPGIWTAETKIIIATDTVHRTLEHAMLTHNAVVYYLAKAVTNDESTE